MRLASIEQKKNERHSAATKRHKKGGRGGGRGVFTHPPAVSSLSIAVHCVQLCSLCRSHTHTGCISGSQAVVPLAPAPSPPPLPLSRPAARRQGRSGSSGVLHRCHCALSLFHTRSCLCCVAPVALSLAPHKTAISKTLSLSPSFPLSLLSSPSRLSPPHSREKNLHALWLCVCLSRPRYLSLSLDLTPRYLDLTQPRGPTDGRRSTLPLQNN